MRRLRDRETTDLLVLLVGGTVCFVIVGLMLSLIISEIARPEHDTSAAASAIGDVINTMVGLLAGFLAGRSEAAVRRQNDVFLTPPPKPEEDEPT